MSGEITGREHWTQKGDVRLFLWNKAPAGADQQTGHDPVRARLVDGLAADLRPAGAGPRRQLGDGVVRQARLRHLVRRHGGLRPLRQEAQHQLRHRQRRRRPCRGVGLHPGQDRIGAAAGLRHLLRRPARRRVRRAPPRAREAPGARRLRVDRRGQPDAGRAQEEAARVPGQEPAPDRQGVRLQHLQPRPSRHRRGQGDRGLRRRHPGARRLGADRHLCGHVLQAAAGRPRQDRDADHPHARAMGRHRQRRGPDRLLQPPAQSRQAVRRDARHLARVASSRRTTCSSITSSGASLRSPIRSTAAEPDWIEGGHHAAVLAQLHAVGSDLRSFSRSARQPRRPTSTSPRPRRKARSSGTRRRRSRRRRRSPSCSRPRPPSRSRCSARADRRSCAASCRSSRPAARRST